jgi:starvation-inducible outer membrane lipoprotein
MMTMNRIYWCDNSDIGIKQQESLSAIIVFADPLLVRNNFLFTLTTVTDDAMDGVKEEDFFFLVMMASSQLLWRVYRNK